jgi:hypothetical protein
MVLLNTWRQFKRCYFKQATVPCSKPLLTNHILSSFHIIWRCVIAAVEGASSNILGISQMTRKYEPVHLSNNFWQHEFLNLCDVSTNAYLDFNANPSGLHVPHVGAKETTETYMTSSIIRCDKVPTLHIPHRTQHSCNSVLNFLIFGSPSVRVG